PLMTTQLKGFRTMQGKRLLLLGVALCFLPLAGCFQGNSVKANDDNLVLCPNFATPPQINVLANDQIGGNVTIDSVTVPNQPINASVVATPPSVFNNVLTVFPSDTVNSNTITF